MNGMAVDINAANDLQCKEPNCVRFAARNSDCCRSCNDKKRWKETANSRQARHRLSVQPERGARPGNELFRSLKCWTGSPNRPENDETPGHWERLMELDRILFEQGPATRAIRERLRGSAESVRQRFLREPPGNADEVNQYFHSLKLIVDAGVDELGELPSLRQHSAEILAFQLRSGDACPLAMATMRHANVLRLLGWESKCKNLMRYAMHMLRESSDARNPRVAVLLHNALFHYLRFFGADWGWGAQNKLMTEIVQRAHDIGTPGARLETLKEAVRHWGFEGSARARA